MTLVLVPDHTGAQVLAGLPGLRTLTYRSGEPFPPGSDEAEVVVVYEDHVEHTLAGLAELPRLRLVQTLVSGVDQWVGRLPAGVALCGARGANGAAVAEWVLSALLALTRRLPEFAAAQAARSWSPCSSGSLLDARVMVLGAGDVGRHVRDLLAPLTDRVLLAGRTARPGVLQQADALRMLPEQDAVVLALPLTEDTRGLVDAAFLDRMADGAVLVNAGRGGLVDQQALVGALRSGRIRAALDVTEPEPLPAQDPLWGCPGLLLTPHVAAATTGELHRLWRIAAEQIATFLAGRIPVNLEAPR